MSGPDVCEHGNDGGKPCAECSPLPAECELEAIAALLVSAVAHTADWRERAQWLFERGVRIQEGPALPAPEPPPRCDHCNREMGLFWACDYQHPMVYRLAAAWGDAVCAHRFDSTVCVAPAGHTGPHITSNAAFPHGLAIGGAALPAEHAPPDPYDPRNPNDPRNWALTDAALIGAFRRVRSVLRELADPRPGILALDDIELHIEALQASRGSRPALAGTDDAIKAAGRVSEAQETTP